MKDKTETVACVCGCGNNRLRYDKHGVEHFYIAGHQNRIRSPKQKANWDKIQVRNGSIPWNKGKSYTFQKKEEYANKGSWNKAMRRLFPNRCMACDWSEAYCDTHHIIPKSQGGKNSIENGIILCPNCHRMADTGILSQKDLRSIKAKTPPFNDTI